MIRVRLTGFKAIDNREYYLKSALLAAFLAQLASFRSKYSDMSIEFGLTRESIQGEIELK